MELAPVSTISKKRVEEVTNNKKKYPVSRILNKKNSKAKTNENNKVVDIDAEIGEVAEWM
jgi:hypothetical protein